MLLEKQQDVEIEINGDKGKIFLVWENAILAKIWRMKESQNYGNRDKRFRQMEQYVQKPGGETS